MLAELSNPHRDYRYFTYLQHLYRRKEVVVYTSLTLSLLAISILGLFALRPTFVTIVSLLKEREIAMATNQKLQEKINNLNQAKVNYDAAIKSQSLISQALPTKPKPDDIALQIELLSQKYNLNISSIYFESVILKDEKGISKIPVTNLGAKEIPFRIAVTGTFENLNAFLSSLENLRRIMVVDSLTLSPTKSEDEKTNTLNLTVFGKAYFIPEKTI